MELREYQRRIAQFLVDHPHACLSVGMGLGKTISTLVFIDHTLQIYPNATFLIVAPKRVAETVWMQEAEKWELWHVLRNMQLIKGTPAKKKKLAEGNAPIKIVSKDNVNYFANQSFDVVVIDELTSFKNMDSKRTQALMSIHATRKIGLTGTFAPNGLVDIYAQLAVLDIASHDRHDFLAWRARWFEDANINRDVPYQRWVLQRGVTEAMVIGDWAKDIITLTTEEYLQIPKLTSRRVPVELTPVEKKAYDDLVTSLHFELPDNLDFAVDEKAKFAKIQTLCSGFVYDPDNGNKALRIPNGGSKIDYAVEFCRRAASEGETVLLFYCYRETAVWFGEKAKEAGLRIASVKGGNEWLDKWNHHDIDVLVANPASAGHGLNLQHGGHIILWLELTYNYEYYAQANARLHRTGQQYPVQIYNLLAKDTVDEAVLSALTRKDGINKRVENATK